MTFYLFDVYFDQINNIEKKIRINNYFYKQVIFKINDLTSDKFIKYYFKTKSRNDLIYNFINILNFISKFYF